MYRIRRIRLAGVGPPDARYDRPSPDAAPFEIDCTGVDGMPSDTVAWLENGGGKTVLLSLIFHVLCPSKAAQVGGDEQGRRGAITDYLGSGDVAHVVLEWAGEDGGVIVTGMVAERRGTNVARHWYLLAGVDGAVDLDRLVFDEDGRRVTARRYLESLEQLATDAGTEGRRRRLRFSRTSVQREWVKLLADHDLDPVLFQYQVRMNQFEGGATKLFKFSSTEKFIEFFLDLTLNEETVAHVTDTLALVADKVQKLPAKEHEFAFASQAVRKLEVLTGTWDRSLEAEAHHQRARAKAEGLDDALAATVAAGEANGATIQEKLDAANDTAAAADRARRNADATARTLAIIAADAALEAANSEKTRLQEVAEAQRLTANAWPRVLTRLQADRLRGESRALDAALARADEAAQPLRDHRDSSLRVLRSALEEHLTQAEADEAAAKEQLAKAESQENDTRSRHQSAQTRRSEASGRIQELEARIAAIDETLEHAVASGLLQRHEDPAVLAEGAAVEGERIEKEIKDLTERHDGLERLRDDLRRKAEEAETALLGAREELAKLASAVERAEQDRLALATHDLAAELAGDNPDLELVGAELAQRAAEEAARCRAEVVAIEADQADDRRAIESLEQDRLLPARSETEELCCLLQQAGLRSALPGWRYLIDTVPKDRHEAVIRAVPAVVDGVVVADDELERAEQALAQVRPSGAVVVAAGSLLLADGMTDAPGQWVVPPAVAMYDRSGAEQELVHRHERVGAHAEHVAELSRREQAATEFSLALTAHLEALPSGTLPALQARKANQAALVAEREAALSALKDERSRAEDGIKQLTRDIPNRMATLRDVEARRAQLERLAERLAERAECRIHVAESQEVIREAEQEADAAERLIGELRALQEQARQLQSVAAETCRSIAKELGTLPVPPPGPAGALAPLESLRSTVERAQKILDDATTDSELAQKAAALDDQLAERSRELSALEPEMRAEVDRLAALPEATSPATRHVAERAAAAAARAADRRVAEGAARLELARQHREALVEPDRPPSDLPELPDDPVALAALATEAEAAAVAARQARTDAETHVNTLEAELKTVRADTASFASQREALQSALGERQAQPADQFRGSVEASAAAVKSHIQTLREAGEQSAEAAKAWRDAAHQLGVFAREDRWATLGGDLRRRLSDTAPEPLAREAANLLASTRLLADRLERDIAELDTHRQLLITSLAEAVDQAKRSLQSARRKSELPSGLGEWSHQPFLKLRLDTPADAVEREARLRRFVNDLLEHAEAGGGLPQGADLICQGVLACAERVPTVDVLKPNKAHRLTYVPITEFATLSGGMRATAAIAMFCTLARVRATNSSGRAGVATLILDNPIGDANATFLVALQRLVAEMSGVQLLYTTGVNDMDALRLFPVLIRLTNEAAKRSHLAYVVADEAFLKALAPSGGGDALVVGTRLVRRHPVPLLLDLDRLAAQDEADLE